MIVGTAGHIDHGKSTLVEALTGKTMDRLAEERARGITIDLNFAPLELPGGEVAGVVDVPGHEDFVRTMVAGAAGMDLVLLVVAADEGIMPQTLEHLAIVEALGVPRGIPVITRCDLVDEEWAELVRGELDARLASSPTRFAMSRLVTAPAGLGVEELRQAIGTEMAAATVPDPGAPFRMPIDRAFSVAGTGTVVTGSIWTGSLAAGVTVRILPSNLAARVRTLEAHGRRVDRLSAGQRGAIGLAGVERTAVQRGDTVVDGRLPWEATTVLDVHLDLLDTAPRPLTTRTRVHLHLGTAEVVARVSPRGPIAPGGAGLARLTAEAPVVAAGGDRFVIRSYSPVHTIGGGRVIDPLPPRRRAALPPGLDATSSGERLRALISRRPPGASTGALALRAGMAPDVVERVLHGDPQVRKVGDTWVPADEIAAAEGRALDTLRAHHDASPTAAGMPVETLRRSAARASILADAAVARLLEAGEILVEGGVARFPGFAPLIPGGEEGMERVLRLVREAGLTAPAVRELETLLEGVDVPGALRSAARTGQVGAVTPDWFVSREALEGFVSCLREVGRGGEIAVGQVRDRTGLSRRYLIPLLEWADRSGITRRDGAVRRLT